MDMIKNDISSLIINQIETFHPKEYSINNTNLDLEDYFMLPKVTVTLKLIQDEKGEEITNITFLDGNYSVQKKMDVSYNLNSYLTDLEIVNLINNLILSYPEFIDFKIESNCLSIELITTLENIKNSITNCYTVAINILSESQIGNEKLSEYLNRIFDLYHEKIVNCSGFARYNNDIKNEFIYNLDNKEMISILSDLSKNQLQSLLTLSDITNFNITIDDQKKVLLKQLNRKK